MRSEPTKATRDMGPCSHDATVIKLPPARCEPRSHECAQITTASDASATGASRAWTPETLSLIHI
eukprot:4146439-Prymnesium_polylepis.1